MVLIALGLDGIGCGINAVGSTGIMRIFNTMTFIVFGIEEKQYKLFNCEE